MGDTLRHLQRYDEAIQIYEQGVKICNVIKSYGEFGANILNSEGLTYLSQEKYDEAISKF
jgi:tetratricopeptide (TPR) repeat protein